MFRTNIGLSRFKRKKMKLSQVPLVSFFLIASANGFMSPVINKQRVAQSVSLNMINDRRNFVKSAGVVVSTAVVTGAVPGIAFAKDFEPKYDDLKVVYELGVTLDRLAAKVADPDQFEAALEGLRSFNKSPGFYPGYARNFISKTVKNNADGDARVGYVKQACNGISSIQELLEGRQGLDGKAASDEAVKRVRKAQALLAKFLSQSGVGDERITAFAAAHSS